MRYFVDKRIMEVVKEDELDFNMLAPEMYYEYRKGVNEGIIIEKWQLPNGKNIDFASATGDQMKSKQREAHFKRHGCYDEYKYLIAYTVPPSWFKEQIEELEE